MDDTILKPGFKDRHDVAMICYGFKNLKQILLISAWTFRMSCLTVLFFRFEKAEFGDIGMIPPHEDHCTELDPGCGSGAGATISERMDRARSVLENPTDISFTIHGGFLKWGYCTPNHLKLDDFSI